MSNTIFTVNSPCQRASIAPYCQRLKVMVKPHRFDHCVRVSILAESIARANKFSESDIRATALAGILHDAARDVSAREMFDLAPPESELEEQHFLTLHGRASRTLAKRWGVNDLRVLDAIEGHVFGVSPSNRIGMAVYIADVSEPARGVNEDIRELAMRNLFRAYQYALDSKVRYLRSKGKVVHPTTLRVYEEICQPVL